MTGAIFNALTGQVHFLSPGKPSAAVAGLRLAESDEFSYRPPAPEALLTADPVPVLAGLT